MIIDKQTIKNLEDAVAILDKRPEETVYIKLGDRDEKYIDWMVTKNAAGCWYYGDTWIYWDGSTYGCKFDPAAFRKPEIEPTNITSE